MLNNKVLIFPSLLSADFACLGEEVRALEKAGADGIHLDIMDGHFVPNLSMGPAIVKSLRPLTSLPLDVHLMTDPVGLFIEPFVKAGADRLTFHVEVSENPLDLLQKIKSFGIKAGLSLRPETSVKTLEPFLEYLDMILVMTVNPGFGGQGFMESLLPKIGEIRKMTSTVAHLINIAVDGGVNPETAIFVKEQGANILIAGNAIFGGNPKNYQANINMLR